jgi:hypothetical protein
LSARSLNLEDSELNSPLIIEHRSKRLDQVPEIPASGDGTPEGAQSPDTSLKRPQLPEISQAPEIAQTLKTGADDIKLSPQPPSIDEDDNKRRSGDEGGEVVESHTNLESGENTSSQQHVVEGNFIDPESKADVEMMHNSQTACPPKVVDEDQLEEVEEEDDDDLLQMPELIVTEEEIDAHKNLAVTCSLPEVEKPPVTLHSDMEKPFNETTDCSTSAQASDLPTQNSTQEAVPESVETETGTGRTTDDDSLISSSSPLLSSTHVLESPPPLSSRIGDDVEPSLMTSHENIHHGTEVKNSTVLIVGEYSTYCSSSTLSSPDMHMLSSALHEDDELEELYASSTSSSPRYKTFCAIFSPPDSPPPRIPPHELFMGAPSLYYTTSQTQTQHPTQTQNQFGSGESSSNFAPGIPVLSLSPSVSTNQSRQAAREASAHLSDESKLLPEIPVSTDLATESSSSPIASDDDDCTPEMSLHHNLDTVKISCLPLQCPG